MGFLRELFLLQASCVFLTFVLCKTCNSFMVSSLCFHEGACDSLDFSERFQLFRLVETLCSPASASRVMPGPSHHHIHTLPASTVDCPGVALRVEMVIARITVMNTGQKRPRNNFLGCSGHLLLGGREHVFVFDLLHNFYRSLKRL